jgi:hypothetical protein
VFSFLCAIVSLTYLVWICDSEPCFRFVSDDDIIENKLVLILSVYTTARRQVLRMITEHIQVLHDALLLEDGRYATR